MKTELKTEQKANPEPADIERAARETNLQGMRSMAGTTVASPQMDTFQAPDNGPRVVSVVPKKASSVGSTSAAKKAQEAADEAARLARIASAEAARATRLEQDLAELPRRYAFARVRLNGYRGQLAALSPGALEAPVRSSFAIMMQTLGLQGTGGMFAEAEKAYILACCKRSNADLTKDIVETHIAAAEQEVRSLQIQADSIADELGVARIDLANPPVETALEHLQESRRQLQRAPQTLEATDGRPVVSWENNARPRPAHKGVSGSQLVSRRQETTA